MMFHRIRQYGPIVAGGVWYRPRAYGDPRSDGIWDGWLIFFPRDRASAIAPPGPETTQSSMAALAGWAEGVSSVYLEGALDRALGLAEQPPIITRLTEAEYQALEDAERLETEATVERTAAKIDEDAAQTARLDAKRLRQERLAAESELAAVEGAAAKVEASLHEQAARDARALAADADRRRRSAQAEAATHAPRPKKSDTRTRRSSKKK
jgi:hypothetical protein